MPSIFTVTDLQAELALIKRDYGFNATFLIHENDISLFSTEAGGVHAWGTSIHEVLKDFHAKCGEDSPIMRKRKAALLAEKTIGL